MAKVRWTPYTTQTVALCPSTTQFRRISVKTCLALGVKNGPTSLDKNLVLNQHLLKKYLRLDNFQSWFSYHKSLNNLRVTSHASRVIGRTDYWHIRLAWRWFHGPIDYPSAMKVLFTHNGGWIYPAPRAAMAMIIISDLTNSLVLSQTVNPAIPRPPELSE